MFVRTNSPVESKFCYPQINKLSWRLFSKKFHNSDKWYKGIVGLPADGMRWSPQHLQLFLKNFIQKERISQETGDRIIEQFRNVYGKQFFELDENGLKKYVADPSISRKLYRDMGGLNFVDMFKKALPSPLFLTTGMVCFTGLLLYLFSNSKEKSLVAATEQRRQVAQSQPETLEEIFSKDIADIVEDLLEQKKSN